MRPRCASCAKVGRRAWSTELTAHCRIETVSLDDPFYDTRKRYRACSLAEVLAFGFGEPVAALGGQTVVFRARDGYARPGDGALLSGRENQPCPSPFEPRRLRR